MPGRTKECTSDVTSGRRRKANQFLDAANVVADLADEADQVSDAYVISLIHAGIAASDVICCVRA